MAVVPIPSRRVGRAGVETLDTAGETDGHTVMWNGRQLALCRNGSGASVDFTVNVYATVVGQTVPNLVEPVPAGEVWVFDVRDPSFRNPATGLVHIDVSAETTVTVGVIEV